MSVLPRVLAATTLLAGLLLSGCTDDDGDVFTPGNPNQLAPPTAVNDTFAGTLNTALTVAAAGVLANDTPNLGTITAFQTPTTQGGTVALNQNGGFTYTPANGFTGADTFTYTLGNSGGSSTATVTINIPAVPVAVNDTFNANLNTQLVVAAAGVLANDTPNGATIAAFQNPSAQGGAVAVNANGGFTYTAANNFFGTDTFTYRLQNATGNSTATVTVNVAGPQFFVDNSVAGPGTGTQADPFKLLSAAVTAAAGVNGAEIVVKRGDGTSTGLNNQVNMLANQTLRAFDANRPRLVGPIFVGNNTRIEGIELAGAPSDAIAAGAIVANVTVRNVLISNSGGHGIAISDNLGSLRIENTTIANASARGITLQPTGALNVFLTNNVITSPRNDGIALSANGAANVNWIESGTRLTSTGAAGLAQGNGWMLELNDTAVLNATHTNCTSNVTNGIGYELNTNSSSNGTAVMVGCNVTGGATTGASISVNDNSSSKARFTNNTFNGNFAGFGFEAGASNTGTLCLRMSSNLSDFYRFFQNDPTATVKIENFGNASGSLFITENTGSVNVLGGSVITNVTIGSCGIP